MILKSDRIGCSAFGWHVGSYCLRDEMAELVVRRDDATSLMFASAVGLEMQMCLLFLDCQGIHW